jgi:Cys-rich protein (TIGR01571 family)
MEDANTPLTGEGGIPSMSDVPDYFLPDTDVCGEATSAEFGPAIALAMESLQQVGDAELTGSNQWQSQWFEVWVDPQVLICGWCCGCVVNARNMSSISGQECEGHCCAGTLTLCLGSCYHAGYRTKMRQKYNLEGSKQLDCLLSFCCGPCLVCQEAREIKYQGLTDGNNYAAMAPEDESMA